MDVSLILMSIASATIGYLVWFWLVVRKLSGPKVWPLVGSLPEMFINRGRINEWTTDHLVSTATATYQTCFICIPFLAPKRRISTFTCHPKTLEHILRIKFDNYPRGPMWQTTFGDILGEGISNSDGEAWILQRKTVAPEFAKSKLVRALHRWINPSIKNNLWPILDNASKQHISIDLQDIMLRFATDIISGLTLGKSLKTLTMELNNDDPIVQAIDTSLSAIFKRVLYPNFLWKLKRSLCVGSERELKKSLQVLDNYISEAWDEHKNDDDDLLSVLMKKKYHNVDENNLTNSVIKSAALNVILAGRDSLSTAISWFLWLVMTNPHAEKKVMHEMSKVLLQSRGEDTKKWIEEPLSLEETNNLVYLQAALLETLRLYPSAPRDFRYAISDDVLPDGTHVPAGSEIIYSIYSVGRMKSIWGEDCLEFKPERWLSPDETRLERPEDGYKFAAFNGGPRNCIGRHLTYLEMKSAASAVLLRYRLSPIPGYRAELKLYFTLSMKNGLKVNLDPRDLTPNSKCCITNYVNP